MKTVVSVSLGSSSRDHEVETEFLGQEFRLRRSGTEGNFKAAQAAIRELDGQVDCIGLGGVDIYLRCKGKRFALRDGLRLAQCAAITPVVDGSGLKDSLESETVRHLVADGRIPIRGKKVLVVSALDRFGMAEALVQAGAETVFGDKIFALNLDDPIHTLDELEIQAQKLLPELTKLPISFLYPVGKSQTQIDPLPLTDGYYAAADLIAGDFHMIRRRMPENLAGKSVLTNTVTAQDVEELRRRGVSYLVTTTPELRGRSFGTNVMEAVFVALLGKPWDEIDHQEYLTLIRELNLKPRIVDLQRG